MKNYRFLIPFLFVFLAFHFAAGQEPTPNKKTAAEKPLAKEKKNVFTKEMIANDPMQDISPEIGVMVEYISVDHSTANQLLSEHAAKSGGAEAIRDILETMLDEETAELKETVWLRSTSGDRAKTESVIESIYPTEFDPAEVPNVVGSVGLGSNGGTDEEGGLARNYMTSGNPTTFECRNVGTTLEMDPVISADRTVIDLSLAPEIVEKIGADYFTREGFEHTSRGIEHMWMPVFYTMKDFTQIMVAPGKYHLLGLHTPHDDPTKRVLVLLRADLISFD
jgi:hypothetical protein